MSEKLAINGGTPVRSIPMPPNYPGATSMGKEEEKEVLEVLASQTLFRYYGPQNPLMKVKQFETDTAKRLGAKNCVAVTSGTASLIVALHAAGIGPGDKVIVPACTFIATPGSVVAVGAVPVFCDIDESMTMDPDKIKDCIDPDVKAIIPVAILGYPCRMDRIMEEAKKYNLIVIEDIAQSMGASFQGKCQGTFGDLGCFSLQINKILSSGEGGCVITNDDKLYERAVRYHDQGMFREKEGFLNVNEEADIFLGADYRMSELSGAVACAQIKKLDSILAKMRKNMRMIQDGIKDIEGIRFATENDPEGVCGNSLIMYFPTVEKKKAFCEAMEAEGTPLACLYNSEPIFMVPQLMQQRVSNKTGFPFNQFDEKIVYTPDMCPAGTDLMARHACVLIGPEHTEQECKDYIAAFRKVAAEIL